MPEVFQYPMISPGWLIDYFDLLAWCIGAVFLSGVWVLFFRYGKFSYGIDLGCLWKTTVMILITTASIGTQRYLSVNFQAKHGQDGDSIKISSDKLLYRDRKGNEKQFKLADITTIYQEPITYNPPAKIYIVAAKASLKDSLFITKNLPGYQRLLSDLSMETGVTVKLR